MPQIANQDYNVIKPLLAGIIADDENALIQLCEHFKRGTLFDVVLYGVEYGQNYPEPLDGLYRVLSVEKNVSGNELRFLCVGTSEDIVHVRSIDIVHVSSLYVEEEIQKQMTPNGGYVGAVAFELDDNGYLKVYDVDDRYISVGGKYIHCVNTNDKISSISLSDVEIPDGVEIAFIQEKDLQNLVGCPLI